MKAILNTLIGFSLLFVLSFAFNLNASAAELLTQEKKELYYQEYLKIAEELRGNSNVDFNVDKPENFNENDWVEPEKFKENLETLINGGINFIVDEKKVNLGEISIFAASPTPTKYVNAYSNSGTFLGQIVVNATVSTKWDEGIKGQVISGISGVNSYTMQGLSHWSQSSATGSKVSAQSWNLKLVGTFTTGGVQFPQAFTINYKTNSNGTIS